MEMGKALSLIWSHICRGTLKGGGDDTYIGSSVPNYFYLDNRIEVYVFETFLIKCCVHYHDAEAEVLSPF
jgi:hypothetical protein